MLDQPPLFLLSHESVSCLCVSELNDRAREALFDCFGPEVWVVGEVHGLKAHAKSGHVYFDLVEKATSGQDQYIAKVGCAFFQGSYRTWQRSLAALGISGFELASGIEVKLRARVDLFTREGRYQLIVSEVDPSYTYGAIARRRTQTIETLKASGLMELNKGLALPAIPLNIGLITSLGSAAYRDFTSIVGGSGFSFRINLYDAHMQGDRTIQEVIRGIRALERIPGLDAIVITRGGGAKTDLLVFDDIGICTAIAACPKPVITGIGHETDLTVADLVAHRSLVTPTDTARFLVARAEAVWSLLEEAHDRVGRSARSSLEASARRLDLAATRLALLSGTFTSRARSTIETASSALTTRVLALTATHGRRLAVVGSALLRQGASCILAKRSALDRAVMGLILNSSSLLRHMNHELAHRQAIVLKELSVNVAAALEKLDRYEDALRTMSPKTTLLRGYSITLGRDRKVLRDAHDAAQEDRITTILAQGTLHSVVYDKEP